MSQHKMFEVTNAHIAALDDEGVRLLVARLCEAELRRRGLPTTAVLYGGQQIAPDGGIDVRVELPADIVDLDGAVPRPNTGFQVKAEPMGAAKIAREMRPAARRADGSRQPSQLRPSIRDLAARRGAYIIASSKDDTTDSMLSDRRQAMAAAVRDAGGCEDLYLDFYDAQRLATWVAEFPGEILWLRARIGKALLGWHPFGNWSGAPFATSTEYLADDKARLKNLRTSQSEPLSISDGIARLRRSLARAGGVVRLTGLSGTGKTRLLEALFDPTVGENGLDPSLAIYADVGREAPEPSLGQIAAQLIAEQKRGVMVLDNCPRQTHDAIAPACRVSNSTISLVTVDLDIQDEKPEGTDVFRLEGSSQDVIERLLGIRFPQVPQAVRGRIADLSDGNARVALLIAESAEHDPRGVSLADLPDEELFRRLFRQRSDADDESLRAAEILSLVYSFDGEPLEDRAAELPLLAAIGGVDTRTLLRATDQLSRRNIIQSRGRWRAILPQPLANWLAKRAFAGLPIGEVAERFRPHRRLLKSFAHRLSYLHDSREAQRIASVWLASDGLIGDLRRVIEEHDVLRMDLLAYLAPVVPGAALELVEALVDQLEAGYLKSTRVPHRHRLISLLRHLAWFPEHFRRTAMVLSRFIPADPGPRRRNQDDRCLEELFWPVLSGVTAGPHVRLQVLEELLSAPDEHSQRAGIIALRGMLTADHFVGSHDFSFGARPVDYGWRPTTADDCVAWFGGALDVARRLALSDSPYRAWVRSIVADAFRPLWRVQCVDTELERIAFEISQHEAWPEAWIAVRTTLALERNEADPTRSARLAELKRRLAPSGVEELLRAYVLTSVHEIACAAWWEADSERSIDGAADRAEPTESRPDTDQATHDAVAEQARALGRACADDPRPFERYWAELFGPNAHQAYFFGEGLAERVCNLREWYRDLRDRFGRCEADKRHASLIGGFLACAASTVPGQVAKLLDEAVSDPVLGPVFPYLQKVVGIDAAGAQRLLLALEFGVASSGVYSNLRFATREVPPAELTPILLRLAEQEGGADVAVEILSMHLADQRSRQAPRDPSLLACGRRLLMGYPLDNPGQHVDYNLGLIVEECLTGRGQLDDARRLCEKMRDVASARSARMRGLDQLVDRLAELHPRVVLDCWLDQTEPVWGNIISELTITSRNPLMKIPTDVLLAWAGEDAQRRYPLLAAWVPLFGTDDEDGGSNLTEIATALLESAPDRAAVFQTLLVARIRPWAWSGSRADMLARRQVLIRRFRDDEDAAIARTSRQLDRALEAEIRDERTREAGRDERFE